jgi:radical SAM protein with 4Fe4S-binding SPASM domain
LGIDEIVLSDLCTTDRYLHPRNFRISQSESQIFKKIIKNIKKTRTKISFRPKNNYLFERNYCKYPWSFPFIDWQGNIMRCWHRPESKEHTFGNIKDVKSFYDIWNSKEYAKFRITLKISQNTPICQKCKFRTFPIETIFGKRY